MGRIFVTGIGLISAIGDTAAANRQSLIAGHSGIGNAVHLQSRYTGLLPFGEIKKSTEALSSLLMFPRPEATRTDLIALHALKAAIDDARLSEQELHKSSTALISASTVGGMCLTDQMYADANTVTASGSHAASVRRGREPVRVEKKGKSLTAKTAKNGRKGREETLEGFSLRPLRNLGVLCG